jgi:hypothetical protein
VHASTPSLATDSRVINNLHVDARRIYRAGVFLGMTLVGAVWLYADRVGIVVERIDRNGRHFETVQRLRLQLWLAVPLAIALLWLARPWIVIKNLETRGARIYGAGIVLGIALTAAVWVYSYRVETTFEYIDRAGRRFHEPEQVSVQPWWGTPVTIALAAVGVSVSAWLLPQSRRVSERLYTYIVRRQSSASS